MWMRIWRNISGWTQWMNLHAHGEWNKGLILSHQLQCAECAIRVSPFTSKWRMEPFEIDSGKPSEQRLERAKSWLTNKRSDWTKILSQQSIFSLFSFILSLLPLFLSSCYVSVRLAITRANFRLFSFAFSFPPMRFGLALVSYSQYYRHQTEPKPDSVAQLRSQPVTREIILIADGSIRD